MRIYAASSWCNQLQPAVIIALREAGHEVYDFRHPEEGDDGFSWSSIDPDWQSWTLEQYRAALKHPLAVAGFSKDHAAMEWADACVYILPCGRSASLELGWFCGQGKPSVVLLADAEPELMIKEADHICITLLEVLAALTQIGAGVAESTGRAPSAWATEEQVGALVVERDQHLRRQVRTLKILTEGFSIGETESGLEQAAADLVAKHNAEQWSLAKDWASAMEDFDEADGAPAVCEGCQRPARYSDDHGVELCRECYDVLVRESWPAGTEVRFTEDDGSISRAKTTSEPWRLRGTWWPGYDWEPPRTLED